MKKRKIKEKSEQLLPSQYFSIRVPLFPEAPRFKKKGISYKGFRSEGVTIEDANANTKPIFKSGRGRKYGSGEILPSHIVSLVNEYPNEYQDPVIEKKVNRPKIDKFDGVAGELEEATNKRYSKKYIKKIYYEAKKRYRPFLVEVESLQP